jgi:tetratricopeptide (TPR) repeat protein
MSSSQAAFGHLARANACLERGDVNGAIDALRSALAHDPMSAPLHALLSLCLIEARRLYAAEHEAKLALELDPELDEAHLALAHVRFAQDRLDETERHLDEAQRIDPDNLSLARLRSQVLRRRGKKQEATRLLEEAVAREPEDTATRLELARAYLEANDLAAADEIAQAVLREAPESHEGLVLSGWVALRRGQSQVALDSAAMALRQNAASPAALRLLVGVKARSSPVLGLWWRANVSLSGLSSSSRVLVLLGSFALYRLGSILASQFELHGLATIVSYAWLGVVVYSWTAPVLFQRMLARELSQVRFRRGF